MKRLLRDVTSRARRACFQLRLGECKFRQTLADEYARGYMAGWRECFQSCIDAVAEEIAAADDASVLRMGKMVIDGRASN